MRLALEQNELIEMCTYDNRRLSMKCTKFNEGSPSIDLLPRVRYMLRVQPMPASQCYFAPSSLFFMKGLLLIPELEIDNMVRRVVAFNISEKTIRLCAGKDLCEGEQQEITRPPPRSAFADRPKDQPDLT